MVAQRYQHIRFTIVMLAMFSFCSSIAFGQTTKSLDQPRTEATPKRLSNAHAHNDYLHEHPLHDALGHGFSSVEADVFLVGGKLLVAHTQFELQPEATLESLYIQPLQQRLEANEGSVYGDGKPFTLLIDFKANGAETYKALERLLNQYPTLTTPIGPQQKTLGPIQIIVSGDRPIEQITKDNCRRVGIDGRLSDLSSDAPADLIPLISDRWSSHFKWRGRGELSADDARKLKSVVQQAHAKGRRIRFWGIPDRPTAWQIMKAAEVDLINTDHLAELQQFLLKNESDKP